jgi:hypothetical protein
MIVMGKVGAEQNFISADDRVASPEKTPLFQLESQLVRQLEGLLISAENPFAQLALGSEFNYVEGKVDVIAANDEGDLFSFEAKLKRWKSAVHQAYRNTSFSHYSYVVLPADAAKHAIKRRHEFERRGVGLCAVDQNGLTVHIEAARKEPLRPWLTDNAIEYIREEKSEI